MKTMKETMREFLMTIKTHLENQNGVLTVLVENNLKLIELLNGAANATELKD